MDDYLEAGKVSAVRDEATPADGQMRADDRDATLRGLTKHEQQLVREAAVMGYVRGTMAHSEDIPADSDVLALVIDCCLGFPDLYPAMKRARRRCSAASTPSEER
jgi:hypothetical protein